MMNLTEALNFLFENCPNVFKPICEELVRLQEVEKQQNETIDEQLLAQMEMYELMMEGTIGIMGIECGEIDPNNIKAISYIYARAISRGLKTIDQVPTNLVCEVQYILDNNLL